jgi:hypothetical protein
MAMEEVAEEFGAKAETIVFLDRKSAAGKASRWFLTSQI